MTLLREKDQLTRQAKADQSEFEDAKKEVVRLEKLLKESEKKRVGLQLLGELKAIKVKNAEARIKALEANTEIETPHDLAKQLQRAITSDRSNRIPPNLKMYLKDELKPVIDSVELVKANKVVTGIVNALLNFSQDCNLEVRRTAGEFKGTRKRLINTTELVEKLQSSTQGHVPTMIIRTLWRILHKELERLKLLNPLSRDTETENEFPDDNQPYRGLRIPQLFPEEHMPFRHQPSFPDPKAYTPSVGLNDLSLLESLSERENNQLANKIMMNDRLIKILMQAIEGNLCENMPPPSLAPKRTFRINRTIVGKSTDTREKSQSCTVDERYLSRDRSSPQESVTVKYNASDSTRRSRNNSQTYGRLDIQSKDEVTEVHRTFSHYDPPSIELTGGRAQFENIPNQALITPPTSVAAKVPRSRILRDAKALSSKFNRTLRDDESISDGIYLLVDSEMTRKRKKSKKR